MSKQKRKRSLIEMYLCVMLTRYQLYWLVFFFDNLIQAEVVLKEGNTTEKMSPLDYPGARLWRIFLINECHGWTQLMGSGANLGKVVLDLVRKQFEHGTWSKSVNSVSPWPLNQFLP